MPPRLRSGRIFPHGRELLPFHDKLGVLIVCGTAPPASVGGVIFNPHHPQDQRRVSYLDNALTTTLFGCSHSVWSVPRLRSGGSFFPYAALHTLHSTSVRLQVPKTETLSPVEESLATSVSGGFSHFKPRFTSTGSLSSGTLKQNDGTRSHARTVVFDVYWKKKAADEKTI